MSDIWWLSFMHSSSWNYICVCWLHVSQIVVPKYVSDMLVMVKHWRDIEQNKFSHCLFMVIHMNKIKGIDLYYYGRLKLGEI